VLPSWLVKVLPGDGRFTHIRVPAGRAPRQWNTKALAVEARGICGECNHWFGAHVEDTAQSVLTRLIRGEVGEIDIHEQLLVSTWAAKTAAMAELTYEEPLRLMSSTVLPAIRTQGTAPLTISIWVGAVEESYETVIAQHVEPSPLTLPTGEELDGAWWFQSLRLGRLAVQVAGHTYPTNLLVETDNDDTGAAFRTWPIRYPRIDWPPAKTIADAEFVNLTFASTAYLVEPNR
jgi:hypothetical protein